ncbi:autophagy-related protein 22-like protein [Phakopsora pachyrhizi]|uniref:Autophagy-related protein n=1 Tax=Phakopsora pachyrhizi TaxID=170000 RepID=A0AAV0AUA4_PHAPC|nr:autophagy-related protein 22-like protein [Phakopsora pachyrhizi]CAH7672303.1 autophagy-related protein 22-like protein [Phakopsora pachyrhizi]
MAFKDLEKHQNEGLAKILPAPSCTETSQNFPAIECSAATVSHPSVISLSQEILPPAENSSAILPSCETSLHINEEELEELQRKSSKHVRGFIAYSVASEMFAIVSTTLFLPLVLEQFSRDNGYLSPLYHDRCPGSKHSDNKATENSTLEYSQCKVKLFKLWISTGTLPLYVSSITVAVQALVIASIISTADEKNVKKCLLVGFALCGSFAATIFFFLDSSNSSWPVSAVISVISNITLAGGNVCLNSLLPGISKEKATVIKTRKGSNSESAQNFNVLVSRCSSQISSHGIAIGFSVGILALCIVVLSAYLHPHEPNIAKYAIGASGVFWAFLTLPTILWIPPTKMDFKFKFTSMFNLSASLRDIWELRKHARPLKNTFFYLIAWLILSSAYSTTTAAAALFGKTDLNMKQSHLIWVGIICPTTGVAGALTLPIIQRYVKYLSGLDSGLRIVTILAYLSSLVPLYISTSDKLGVLSLNNENGLFVLAGFFGFFYGAFQAYSRTVYAEFIPVGQEAKWFALFNIVSKFFTCICTLVVGLITDHTGSMRRGFLFIVVLYLSSLPFLHIIKMEEGKQSAKKYSIEQRTTKFQ